MKPFYLSVESAYIHHHQSEHNGTGVLIIARRDATSDGEEEAEEVVLARCHRDTDPMKFSNLVLGNLRYLHSFFDVPIRWDSKLSWVRRNIWQLLRDEVRRRRATRPTTRGLCLPDR